MAEIKFYNLPHHYCRCRNNKGSLTPIARKYRKFYELLVEKQDVVQVLKEMEIKRMCCRERFLAIPVVPMIDRSKNRFYNDTKNIIKADTRELKPGVQPPDFPLLEV